MIGSQYMLVGFIGHEIVVEVEVPIEMREGLIVSGPVSDEFAQSVLKAIPWETSVIPERWELEIQALYIFR